MKLSNQILSIGILSLIVIYVLSLNSIVSSMLGAYELYAGKTEEKIKGSLCIDLEPFNKITLKDFGGRLIQIEKGTKHQIQILNNDINDINELKKYFLIEDSELIFFDKLSKQSSDEVLYKNGYVSIITENMHPDIIITTPDLLSISSIYNKVKFKNTDFDSLSIQGTGMVYDFINVKTKYIEMNLQGGLMRGGIDSEYAKINVSYCEFALEKSKARNADFHVRNAKFSWGEVTDTLEIRINDECLLLFGEMPKHTIWLSNLNQENLWIKDHNGYYKRYTDYEL